MQTPQTTMSKANELVDDIRREHGWSTEKLAERTGYSRTQTNYFCNGQATPPSEFLGSLFEATLDSRLLNLNSGRVPIGWEILAPRKVNDLSDPETMRAAIDQSRKNGDAIRAFLDLLENGINPAEPGERARLDEFACKAQGAADALRDLVADSRALFDKRAAEHADRARHNGRPTRVAPSVAN